MAAPIEGDLTAETKEMLCEIEATVVTGFETQAQEEILEKFNVSATTERGKVNFFIPVEISRKVLELSSIDNAFVILNHYRDFVFAQDEESIMQQFRELIPQLDWELGLRVWSEFFSFSHPISLHPTQREPPSDDKQPLAPVGGDTHIHVVADLQGEPLSDNKQSTGGDTLIVADPQGEPRTVSDKIPGGVEEDGHNLPSADDKDCEEQTKQHGEPEPKRARQTTWDPTMPAFRATCYRSGKHIFQSPQAACDFGGEINNYFGWNVSMKNFDIEVTLTIESRHVYVGLALTKVSLHRRNISKFGVTTLRPTIAYNMLRFCQIKDHEVVCDPMCGGGSIPIEGVLNWPRSLHLCGDINDVAVPKTKENIDIINESRLASGRKAVPLSVFKWDACSLPLRDKSVDVFISDMPFGKRSGSKLRNWHLYPRVMEDMARVCTPGTGRACLLTHDRKCFNKSLISLEHLWRRGPSMCINIGGLYAGVFLLYRTSRIYMTPSQLQEDNAHRLETTQQKQQEMERDTAAETDDS